jgi:hypothetical protein
MVLTIACSSVILSINRLPDAFAGAGSRPTRFKYVELRSFTPGCTSAGALSGLASPYSNCWCIKPNYRVRARISLKKKVAFGPGTRRLRVPKGAGLCRLGCLLLRYGGALRDRPDTWNHSRRTARERFTNALKLAGCLSFRTGFATTYLLSIKSLVLANRSFGLFSGRLLLRR